MSVADTLVWLGGRLIRGRFKQPANHWRARTWDGFRAERHPVLGPAYVEEREAIRDALLGVVEGACVLDVAAGTGRYSLEAARAGAIHVTALDISPNALQALRRFTIEAGLDELVSCVEGDFWDVGDTCWCGRQFDVYLCLDAIHHLGRLPVVLARLSDLAGSTSSVIGDVWTRDHFGEFQCARRSGLEHALASLRFLVGAALVATRIRPTSAAVRSDLRAADEVERELTSLWPHVSSRRSRYWVRFVRLPETGV